MARLDWCWCVVVEPARRTWGPWNFVGFWVADSFNIVCPIFVLRIGVGRAGLKWRTEHMDDLLVDDYGGALLVAIVALRVDRLLFRRLFHLLHWPHRRNLPHSIPRRRPGLVRHLGLAMASLQPRRNGVRVVRRADVDRRDLHLPHDSVDLELIRQPPQQPPRKLGHEHARLCRLLPLLGAFAASNLVPGAPDPPPVYGKVVHRTRGRVRLLWVVYSQGWRGGAHNTSRQHCSWECPCLGIRQRDHVIHCELFDADC